MGSITGIELGTDSCVLVRARRRGSVTEVAAVHSIEAGEWPDQDVALAALLRRVRRERHLPRRAHVVAWHLPESASIADPATRGALRPLTSAGFRVQAIFSPPRALALLASARPRGEAGAAWLALNRHGAAIAIVRGAELLFARAFDWSYKGSGAGPNAQLLERYSLVAHLAPEVRRGIELARSDHGVRVECVITCGDLPDLRSLTMPLIEELDLEVETLDSVEGLAITAAARTQRVAELAPALRLACAAATAPGPVASSAAPKWAKTAAASIVLAGVAWWGYSRWTGSIIQPPPRQVSTGRPASQPPTPSTSRGRSTSPPRQGSPQADRPRGPAPGSPTRTAQGQAPSSSPSSASSSSTSTSSLRSSAKTTPSPAAPPSSRATPSTTQASRAPAAPAPVRGTPSAQETAPPARSTTAATQQPPAARSGAPAPPGRTSQSPAPSASARGVTTAPPSIGSAKPQASGPAPQRVVATPPPQSAARQPPEPSRKPSPTPPASAPAGSAVGSARGAGPAPATPSATTGHPPASVSAGTREGERPATSDRSGNSAAAKVEPAPTDRGGAVPATPPRPRALPKPLDAPVPSVTSILISSDRRLAVIDGRIVGVGDPVGARVVARIEQTAVVLREPSGFELRVPLR